MEIDYPGKRPSGFIYDLAYADQSVDTFAQVDDDFEQKRLERDETRQAIRNVIKDAMSDSSQVSIVEVPDNA